MCSVVIDSGSIENFVSQEMVDKLALRIEQLSSPYKVAWFKEGCEVLVNIRCLVKFSIGKNYRDDEGWCDVVPLEVCHILLGRPRPSMMEKRTHTPLKRTTWK